MHKNWVAIATAPSPLKEYLIAEEDPKILERLAVAFPEYFSSQPAEPSCYPASLLRKRAKAHYEEQSPKNLLGAAQDAEFEWDTVLPESIPRIIFNSSDNPIPPEIWKQLIGQKIQGGIPIEWQGGRYVTIFLSPATSRKGAKINQKFMEFVQQLYLVPARFIDLEH